MSEKDKGKGTQNDNDTTFLPLTNYPHEPLPFYLWDHELYYIALSGPHYNEYVIFFD